ncbi:signal peptidase II [Clostridium sp. USBA 49]|jgi:signal peptidase II|uniref:signal peptidase II n=1 Tax=Clostridium TaxID=1485 RepID=UPI00099AD93E|nr:MULTISPECIES: signal peptidase II [Clostridium]SKA76922.1 signal peptidase II [Clostridium sp. USBA 49]
MEILIILLGIILDRVTKIWALKSLSHKDEIVVIKNIFSFSYLENRGAAFGIFQNKIIFLSIITIVVIAVMIYYLFNHKFSSKLIRISLSLIISGALGNLIDRVIYKFVVDFILLHYKDIYYYPTFNVADMLVVFGTILLAICIIKDEK